MSSIRSLVMLTGVALMALPVIAGAASYSFETVQGAGGFVGTANGCTAADNCSSQANVGFGGALGFSNASFGALSVTGQYKNGSTWQTATVVQDDNGSNPKWVGLGVYHTITGTSPNKSFVANDDNITSMEALVLTFANTVTLTNVKLRAEGHGAAFAAGTSFKYGVGPVDASPQYTMAFVPGQFNYNITDMTGTQFVFYGLPNITISGNSVKQEYYLSEVTVVPEPEAYGLALAGMGVVVFAMRRRREH